jgi:hypothetical protein
MKTPVDFRKQVLSQSTIQRLPLQLSVEPVLQWSSSVGAQTRTQAGYRTSHHQVSGQWSTKHLTVRATAQVLPHPFPAITPSLVFPEVTPILLVLSVRSCLVSLLPQPQNRDVRREIPSFHRSPRSLHSTSHDQDLRRTRPRLQHRPGPISCASLRQATAET